MHWIHRQRCTGQPVRGVSLVPERGKLAQLNAIADKTSHDKTHKTHQSILKNFAVQPDGSNMIKNKWSEMCPGSSLTKALTALTTPQYLIQTTSKG